MTALAAACRLTQPVLRRHSTWMMQQLRGGQSGAMQPAMDVESWNLPLVADRLERKQDTERGIQWIFLGCPGVGKGTYASRLSNSLGVPHIAMGDLVREELAHSTPTAKKLASLVNQGKLLPDDIILELFSKRLEKGVKSGETGFILDGIPRTQSQAEILEQAAEIDLVVNLRLREDVLVLKCLGRRICSGCGGSYNLAKIDVEGVSGGPRIYMPPLLPPPKCAQKLTVRADDTEEVVRERLRIYAEETKPVEEYYRSQGKLLDFNVAGGIPETWPRLLAALNLDGSHETQRIAA